MAAPVGGRLCGERTARSGVGRGAVQEHTVQIRMERLKAAEKEGD
jgi:hypothetical protein